jgi:hypothetical protein
VPRVNRTARLAALTVAALLVLPTATAAAASAYARVLHAYEATGTIPTCEFTSTELEGALKGVDTYGAQYFQDFTTAVQGALAARGTGSCEKTHAKLQAGGPAARPLGAISPASVRAATSASIPAPILLMAGIAALIALAAALVSITRLYGVQPEWAQAWRHAWREAGYRTAGTWADFSDWLRSRD